MFTRMRLKQIKKQLSTSIRKNGSAMMDFMQSRGFLYKNMYHAFRKSIFQLLNYNLLLRHTLPSVLDFSLVRSSKCLIKTIKFDPKKGVCLKEG